MSSMLSSSSVENPRQFLASKVTPLLTPVVEKMLIDRPEDVAGYISKALSSAPQTAPESKSEPLLAEDEGIEKDTAEAEDVSDLELMKLLLPDGTLPAINHPTISQFSISYSSALLGGWVKQRSPGCAAASVAGAVNALRGCHRSAPGALSMDNVIEVLKDIQRRRAEDRGARVERLLCGVSLEPLTSKLREHLDREHGGKSLGGKNKATSAGKKLIRSSVKHLVFLRYRSTTDLDASERNISLLREADENAAGNGASMHALAVESPTKVSAGTESEEGSKFDSLNGGQDRETFVSPSVLDVPADEWVHREPIFTSIRELEEMKEISKMEMKDQVAGGVGLASQAILVEEGDEVESENDGNEDSVEGKSQSTTSSSSPGFNWLSEICGYFERLAGLEKLCRPKPSTAAFGNWGILAAVREINESDETGNFAGKLFMGRGGRGSKVQHKISPVMSSDPLRCEAETERQWQMLKLEHSHPNSVLLSHHKNHYALIFAVRDWVEEPRHSLDDDEADNEAPKKRRVRQVLTARRGQRPKEWIDWEELRGFYLKWAGYKLMSIRFSPFVQSTSFAVRK